MNIKITVEKELRIERQQRLALQAENEQLSEIFVDKLLDLEFTQILNEVGDDL